MEFTPGPWEARIVEGGLLDSVWVVTDCEGGLVPRTKENTQLQAAAPDMYKALETFLETGDAYFFDDAMELMKNALQKARGE